VSCEDGTVRLYDTRAKGSAPEWTLQAHEKPVSGLDLHPTIAGMMVTSSPDRTSKIWDIASGKPKLVLSRDLGAGQVFGASFSPDFAGLVVGGTGGKVVVWDTEENAVVRRAFEGRIAEDEVLKAALADEEEVGEGEGRKGRREVVATEDGEGSEGDSDDSEDDGEGEEEEDEDDDEMEED
jgi:WD40 repeat protein